MTEKEINKLVQTPEGTRIKYVDPVAIAGYGGDDKSTIITPPYEDLSIAFNLIIEKYSRLDIATKNEYCLHFCNTFDNNESTEGSVLSGTISDNNGKSYLTTYYTDISADGYGEKEQIEGLGVESVNISFDSYYTPTVDIKFVDVRGSALFGREEATHSDPIGSGRINADNFFGAFFTQPYPKFRLQVKGFYGKDVTYQLTVSKFKANFNSQTGNVEINVSFIGYTWSLLTDIPLLYLMAAPYCEYVGKSYWDEHCNSDNTWQLRNSDQINTTTTKPKRLFDFFDDIMKCMRETKDSDVLLGKSLSQQEIDACVEADLKTIQDLINKIKRLCNGHCGDDVLISGENVAAIKDEVEKLCIEINKFNSKTDRVALFEEQVYNQQTTAVATKNSFYKETDDGIYVVSLKPLENRIQKRIEAKQLAREEIERASREQFIVDSLSKIGFDPNIYNIFKLLMCHLETFCHIFFEAAKEIQQQKVNNERTPELLCAQFANSDIPSLKTDQFPPWPMIYKSSDSNINNKDKIEYSDQYTWVGNLSENWVEAKVVMALQKAIQQLQPSDPDKDIVNTPSLNNNMPLLPSDIINNGNVFKYVPKQTFDGLCGNLAIRATQLFNVMDKEISSDDNIVKAMGEIDAYNYYLACLSEEDLKNKVLNNTGENNGNLILDIATCRGNFEKQYGSIKKDDGEQRYVFEKENIRKDGRQPVLKENGDNFEYVYSNEIKNNNDEDDKCIIPSNLVDFGEKYNHIATIDSDKGNKYFIPTYQENGDAPADVTTWLYTNKNQAIDRINKQMFGIIEDRRYLESLRQWKKRVNDKELKFKNYEVSDVSNISSLIDRYWSIENKDLKSILSISYSSHLFGLSWNKHLIKYKSNDIYRGFGEKKDWTHDMYLNRQSNGTIYPVTYSLSYEEDEVKLKDTDRGEEYSIEDDFCVKYFPIYIKQGDTYEEYGSFFGNPFYYMQNNYFEKDAREGKIRAARARAYLFLNALPKGYNINTTTRTSNFTTDSLPVNITDFLGSDELLFTLKNYGGFEIYTKIRLLYVGALLYRQKYFKEKGRDLIQYEGEVKISLQNEEICKTFKFESGVVGGELRILGGETNRLVITNASTDNKVKINTVPIETYIGYELDDNVKNQLIDYFIHWVDYEYVNFERQCCCINDYGEPATLGYYAVVLENLIRKTKNYGNQIKEHFPSYYQVYTGEDSNNNYTIYLFPDESKQEIHNFVKELVFGSVLVYSNSALKDHSDKNMMVGQTVRNYISSFVKTLDNIYRGVTNDQTPYDTTGLKNDIDVNENILLSTYIYCKDVWDKWLLPLSSNNDSERNEHFFDVRNFFGQNFVFIDQYYNNIGTKLKINLEELYNSYLSRFKESNLYQFIGDIIAKHNCTFTGLPDYINLGIGDGKNNSEGVNNLINMFKPIPFSQMRLPRNNNNFVIMYLSRPATKLPDDETYRTDGFDLYSKTDNNDIQKIFADVGKNLDDIDPTTGEPTRYGYDVPSFAVAFGRQDNHLFKNMSIGMDNPVQTEQSIRTTFNAAALAKNNKNKVQFYGQDIYNIFSNYSYQVEVEMMGNAQIQPLMYFQLLNVPMWRGAYMIFKVNHTLTPGNMVTRFRGMKMSRYPVPIPSKYWTWLFDGESHSSSTGSSSNNGGNYNSNTALYKGKYIGDLTTSKYVQPASASELNLTGNTETDKGKICKVPNVTTHCSDVSDKYFNVTHNNYIPDMPNIIVDTGKVSFNVTKAVNYIYNLSHLNTNEKSANKCKEKSSTQYAGRCARHVWSAVYAGCGIYNDGHAWSYKDATPEETPLVDKIGYIRIYSSGNGESLPRQSFPGDIVLQYYPDRNTGEESGHAQMFTGEHWVSDAIQRSCCAGHDIDTIYAIYRLPGIEDKINAIRVSDNAENSNDSINTTDEKSIFETNRNYNYNAFCQPEGKFIYNRENIKKGVLYFVAHGEGGNNFYKWINNKRKKMGESQDYCGINIINTSFYTSERKAKLKKIPQNGFDKSLDEAVFDFYYDAYYKKIQDFLEKCRNPYTRYMGVLALKAGIGFYDQGFKEVGGKDYNRLGEKGYTSNLGDKWAEVIEKGYTKPDETHQGGYGSDNTVYWDSVENARKYDEIY